MSTWAHNQTADKRTATGLQPAVGDPLIVIQCRYGSSRLPGKALYPLAGTPMLAFLIRRLAWGLAETPHRLVVATTTHRQDDAVAAWAAQEGAEVFRGPEDDVLGRYLGCLERFPAQTVVRVTADNPLTCPGLIIRSLDRAGAEGADYFYFQATPFGAGADVFSAEALKAAARRTDDDLDHEHINRFIINRPEGFKVSRPEIDPPLNRPDVRVTVDTPEDWRRLKDIFRPDEAEPWKLELNEAIERLDRRAV